MILRRSSIIAAAALLLAACATAPDAPVVPPSAATDAFAVASAATPQFSAQRLSDHIKYLADDRLEGRFPGLVGERLTLEYLQAQYEAMGLEPGGRDGSWLQPVDLVRFTPERPPVATWTGADGVSHDLTSGADITLRAGPADPVVKVSDAPLVFAGYGIVAPERGWDDYGSTDLTGKVVVILRGQPESMGADPNFYGSGEHKTQEALKRGAVGVISLQDVEGRWRRAVGGAQPQRLDGRAVDGRRGDALALREAHAHDPRRDGRGDREGDAAAGARERKSLLAAVGAARRALVLRSRARSGRLRCREQRRQRRLHPLGLARIRLRHRGDHRQPLLRLVGIASEEAALDGVALAFADELSVRAERTHRTTAPNARARRLGARLRARRRHVGCT